MKGFIFAALTLTSITCAAHATNDYIKFNFYAQGDSITFWGDKRDLVNNETNLISGVNIPRARYFVLGKKFDWYYQLSYDVAEESVRDAFLRYEEYDSFHIIFGQYRIPYSLWFSTPQPKLNFLEFGLPIDAFVPGFRGGLQLQLFADPFTLTFGLVSPDVNNTIMDNNLKGHVPLAGSGRITFVPIHNEDTVIHFAAAAIYQQPDSLYRFRFRTVPEVQTTQNYTLVDTGFIPGCENYVGQEGEMALIFKSFCLEGEFYHNQVHRNWDDLVFTGFFFTADYFLTGEHYQYNFKEGILAGVKKINHDYGAWQIAFRYSNVNLSDQDIHGGRETNLSFGLNWIVNDNYKFLVNYIIVDTDPSENGLNRHVNILALRFLLTV